MKIGITGHQDLGGKVDHRWVYTTIEGFISSLNERLYGFSSIALGADRLFCDVLTSKSISYTVVVPCENYRSLFDNSVEYDGYLDNAKDNIILDHTTESEEAFYDAGKVVVDNCDLLIAVWDGQPAKGLGGTGDVVKYAKSIHRTVYHIHNVKKSKAYL